MDVIDECVRDVDDLGGREPADGKRLVERLEPDSRVDALVAWLDAPPRNPAAVDRVLRGPVAAFVRAYEAEIGLWFE